MNLLDFRIRLADGHEQDVLDVDAIGDFVLLDVLLILSFELILGDVDVLADLVDVHDGEANDTLFRDLIIGLIFL